VLAELLGHTKGLLITGLVPRPLLFFPAAILAGRALRAAYGLHECEQSSWPLPLLAPEDLSVTSARDDLPTPLCLGHEALLEPHPLCAASLCSRTPAFTVVTADEEHEDPADRDVLVCTDETAQWGAGDRDALMQQADLFLRRLRALERKGARHIDVVLGGLECCHGFVELASELASRPWSGRESRHTCLATVEVAAGDWLDSCAVRVCSWASPGAFTLETRSPSTLRPVVVLNAYAVLPRVLRLLMENALLHVPHRPLLLFMGAPPPTTLRWRGLSPDLAAVAAEAERQQAEWPCHSEPLPLPPVTAEPRAHRVKRFTRRPLSLAVAPLDITGAGLLVSCGAKLVDSTVDLLFLPRVFHDSCRRVYSVAPDPDLSPDEWQWISSATVVRRDGSCLPLYQPQDVVPIATVPVSLAERLPALPVLRGEGVPVVCPFQPLFA